MELTGSKLIECIVFVYKLCFIFDSNKTFHTFWLLTFSEIFDPHTDSKENNLLIIFPRWSVEIRKEVFFEGPLKVKQMAINDINVVAISHF